MTTSAGLSVLICGAGPVGLTAALELARRGIPVRIVDREDGPAPLAESRALAVNARTLTLLQPSGATDGILAQAREVHEMRISSDGRTLAAIDLMQTEGRYKGMHCLAQGATERILIERLASHGVAPEWNTEAAGIGSDPARPEVNLQRDDGATETARADIVIDAEGAHSPIRRALQLQFPGRSVENEFYIADYRYGGAIDTSRAGATFFNPGVIARIPVSADVLRYVSTMPDFAERIDHPAPVAEVTWKTQFRVSFRHVDPMSKGAFFLAGDAAHIHSPVGGRGMNLGIEDACWLAWLISEGRQGEYSRIRVPIAAQVLRQTHQLTRMILMQNPVATSLRNMALPIATRLPPVRHRLLRAVTGSDTPPPPWL